MNPITNVPFETIRIRELDPFPEIDALVTSCRINKEQYLFDAIDFADKSIQRWSLPLFSSPPILKQLENDLDVQYLPVGIDTHEQFLKNRFFEPHVAQLSPNGKLFVSLGNGANGPFVLIIDSRDHTARMTPGDYESNRMLYTATGDLTSDHRHFVFARWPLEDTIGILNKEQEAVACQIGRMNVDTLDMDIVYQLESDDNLHQSTCSSDNRYVVFTPFRLDPVIPYPRVLPNEDPDGYRRSHLSGINKCKMVTIDLGKKRHWETEIPTPVPAHFEFDPIDPHVFYVSAHNFASSRFGIVIEGQAAIYKMRITEQQTIVDGCFSDDEFFRITQHTPFCYDGQTFIAVTTIPNKLDIIEARTMQLWRRIELFAAPPLDFTRTGNVLCPKYPNMCLNVSPSNDGRFIILESPRSFVIYSMDEDRLYNDIVVPNYMPENTGISGHSRLAGC